MVMEKENTSKRAVFNQKPKQKNLIISIFVENKCQ